MALMGGGWCWEHKKSFTLKQCDSMKKHLLFFTFLTQFFRPAEESLSFFLFSPPTLSAAVNGVILAVTE